MAKDYLDQLAEFVTSVKVEQLPASTVAAARDVALDTIGAVAAGSRLPENVNLAALARSMGGRGNSTLLGHPHRVPAGPGLHWSTPPPASPWKWTRAAGWGAGIRPSTSRPRP